MSIPQKKQFWKIKSVEGATTPKKLWKAACEYFNWCDNNPLNEEKLFHYQGNVSKENISKMRAYTLTGLCLYLDCSTAYLEALKTTEGKNQAEFVDIINRIEEAIYTQQLTGAASDQLNATIVAKNLGLASKTDLSRVHAAVPFIEARRCVLIKGDWNESFVHQCATFPNAKLKDKVDCLTAAINKATSQQNQLQNWSIF